MSSRYAILMIRRQGVGSYDPRMTGALVAQSQLLRSPPFDRALIGGTAALALGAGVLVVAEPGLFGLVLLLDLWLLGYHHVFSTFTRFVVDRAALREHRTLLTRWPAGIAGAVAVVGIGIGPWALVTIYLYWQWFHYVRQSWGIARAYQRTAGGSIPEPGPLFSAIFWAVPVWGILHRSHQDPDQFLFVDVWTLPVASFVADLAGVVAAILILVGVVSRARAWIRGDLPVAHTLMVLSHLSVFAVGYVVIDDIDTGWLTINIWHNAQYILFVWHANNRQVDRDRRAGFVHAICASNRIGWYLVASIVASTVIYGVLGLTLAAATSVIVYQVINFHHYVTDGRIWKTRRSSSRQRLDPA